MRENAVHVFFTKGDVLQFDDPARMDSYIDAELAGDE